MNSSFQQMWEDSINAHVNVYISRPAKKFTQASVNRKRKFAASPAPRELQLHDFITRTKEKKGPAAKLAKTVGALCIWLLYFKTISTLIIRLYCGSELACSQFSLEHYVISPSKYGHGKKLVLLIFIA